MLMCTYVSLPRFTCTGDHNHFLPFVSDLTGYHVPLCAYVLPVEVEVKEDRAHTVQLIVTNDPNIMNGIL